MACTRTRTWPRPATGSGTSSSSRTSGPPNSCARIACMRRLLHARELFVNDLFERFERLGAHQRAAVDVDRGRRIDTHTLAELVVGLDVRRVLAGIETRLELGAVKPELPRRLFQRRHVQRALIRQHRVMQLQVLALLAGAMRRFSRLEGLGVVWQREILEDEADLVTVALLDFRESRTDSRTERSLIVGEFHQRHRRCGLSAYRIVVLDRYRIAWRIEHHFDAAFALGFELRH